MVQPVPNLAASYLAANAERRPAAPAVIDPERTLTFSELWDAVGKAAGALSAQGVGRGDVVGVHLANVWEYVVLELAIPLLEAIILPLPLSLGEAELRHALERTAAKLVVDSEATAAALASGDGRPWFALPAPDPARVVEIALTSGTTGMPKLASLTAGLKQATFEGFTHRLEIVPEDRVLIMSPLTQGIGGMCLFCLRRGAALVMLREPRFTAQHTLALAERTRATLLVGVPTNLVRLLESPALAGADLSTLRCTAVAGARLPPDVARAWEERSGSRVVSFYGSMDAGQLAVGSPSDPADKRWHTVGRPHDSCECRIVDAAGQALPVGEVGEICMRGPTVQTRYWGEESGPLAADGWAHMGDLGRLDPDGYLEVVGRLKDIIIRGGSNINPYEVEEHIRSHPGVQEVAVVGRPDRDLGERAVAFVVGTLTLEELREHLLQRGVARYKWPEAVELLSELPLSGPGKLNRRALKEMASAGS